MLFRPSPKVAASPNGPEVWGVTPMGKAVPLGWQLRLHSYYLLKQGQVREAAACAFSPGPFPGRRWWPVRKATPSSQASLSLHLSEASHLVWSQTKPPPALTRQASRTRGRGRVPGGLKGE